MVAGPRAGGRPIIMPRLCHDPPSAFENPVARLLAPDGHGRPRAARDERVEFWARWRDGRRGQRSRPSTRRRAPAASRASLSGPRATAAPRRRAERGAGWPVARFLDPVARAPTSCAWVVVRREIDCRARQRAKCEGSHRHAAPRSRRHARPRIPATNGSNGASGCDDGTAGEDARSQRKTTASRASRSARERRRRRAGAQNTSFSYRRDGGEPGESRTASREERTTAGRRRSARRGPARDRRRRREGAQNARIDDGAACRRRRSLAEKAPSRASRSRPSSPTGAARATDHIGKRCATYPANFCPLQCGGAMSHSRRRTTILHSEDGDCKRFL
jgi:hypothetical protein